MFYIENINDLYNFIGYFVLSAPDRFPIEDYRPPDMQMTLDIAFQRLREGILVAYPEPRFEEKRRVLSAILDRAFEAYVAGDRKTGISHIHEFEGQIFHRKGRRRTS